MINIVLCTYNGEKYLMQQLESIRNNTFTDWKIYVFDDISSDDTLKILNDFKNRYPTKIEISINSERKGWNSNFIHAAFEISKSMKTEDMMMFCDQDDIWNADKIERTYLEMKRLTGDYGNDVPLLVHGDAEITDENGNVLGKTFQKMMHYRHDHLDLSHHLMEAHVQGCTSMINKSLACSMKNVSEATSGYDEWIGMIAYALGHVSYIEEPLLKYRRHDSQVTSGTLNFWDIVGSKIGHLSEQKQYVFGYSREVRDFIQIFDGRIDDRSMEILMDFATLKDQGFWQRREIIIRDHFWKSGFLRNIGLMLLM